MRSDQQPDDQTAGTAERPAGGDRRIREAQAAHGGSMAPGLVDATGNPVADAPPGPEQQAGEETGT